MRDFESPPSRAAQELEVRAAAQVGVEGGRLDEPGDPVERLHAHLRVAPEEPDRAGGGADQAQHHSQRGRLAGAVRAEVAEDVAALDRQVDVVDRDDAPIALGEAADLDRRGVAHPAQSPRAAALATGGRTEPTTV